MKTGGAKNGSSLKKIVLKCVNLQYLSLITQRLVYVICGNKCIIIMIMSVYYHNQAPYIF